MYVCMFVCMYLFLYVCKCNGWVDFVYGNKQLIVCVCACVLCLHAVETKLFVDLSSESSFFDGTILSGMRNIGCQGFNKKT